jgi:hypothetical protein
MFLVLRGSGYREQNPQPDSLNPDTVADPVYFNNIKAERNQKKIVVVAI